MMNREPSPGRLLSGVGQRVNGRRLSPFAVIRSFFVRGHQNWVSGSKSNAQLFLTTDLSSCKP